MFNEFHTGVALFFVLSGFLIAYTYADEPMRSGKAYTRYILLRMARILPLYWLILTAFYLDPAYGKMKLSWLTYSLFHGFSDKHNLEGIAQAWSLSAELMFYFFAPLLCLLQKRSLFYLLASLVLLFGLTWGAGALWHYLNGNPERFFYPLRFILTGTFPGRSAEFLAGMLLAAVIRNKQTAWLERMRFKTAVGFVGIFGTIYCIGLFEPGIYGYGRDHTMGMIVQLFVLPVFVVLALAGLIYERTWLQTFFASKTLVLLGNASFAFYLVHISYVSLKLREWILLPDRNFVLLWMVSIILYLAFEKPLYNLCRKKLK